MCSRILKTRWPKVRAVSNTASPYLKPRSRNGTRTSGSGRKRPLKYAMRSRAVVMTWASSPAPGRSRRLGVYGIAWPSARRTAQRMSSRGRCSPDQRAAVTGASSMCAILRAPSVVRGLLASHRPTVSAWRRVMDRRAVLIVLIAVSTLVLGATSGLSQGGKVAMLLPGSINDQSWNAAGYSGLVKLKDKGLEIAYSENVQAADHVEAMKDYARRGFSPVIGHSGRFLSAAQRVGPEFDNAIFLVGSGSSGQGNVTSLDVANEQYAYVVGVLAGRMTKSGKVGAVAGLEGLPNMIASMGGFRLGVKSVKPDAEVKIIYLQSMEDPAAAKEAALTLIAGGADVIGGKLNAGHAGIIQAAKDKGVYAAGRSVGHTAIAPERVLTNIDERWGDIYVSAVSELRAGKLNGNYIPYGYNTPTAGADLRYTTDRSLNPVVPANVAAELETVKKKIASGEIKIKPTKD